MTIRAERAEAVHRLLSQGYNGIEISRMLSLSRSYTYSLIHDPTGEQDRARKDAYAGVCEDCGNPTNGSDGPGKAPKLCNHCAPKREKYWTRERVIEAIQLWARLHDGKPPVATDWLVGAAMRDVGGHRFPPASSCYRGSGLESAPFEYWADAIEAAGFPRPRIGHYERTLMPGRAERTYLVFKVDNEQLSLVGEAVATSNQEAVETAAMGKGKFASVAKGSLLFFDLEPRLVASKASDA
jgi:hypothetical protein